MKIARLIKRDRENRLVELRALLQIWGYYTGPVEEILEAELEASNSLVRTNEILREHIKRRDRKISALRQKLVHFETEGLV